MEDGTAYLIVGLGNPGREYRKNRHNIGFMMVDRLGVKLNVRFARLQANALVASTHFEGGKIILAKPQTYMNLSGRSVRGLMKFYKIPLENLMIVHDDLDIPVGNIRIRPDGGSAGQKGMASIIENLGTDEFARIRIGIGRPPGQMTAPDYVLQDFSDSELNMLGDVLARCVEAAIDFTLNGLNSTMNKFNKASD